MVVVTVALVIGLDTLRGPPPPVPVPPDLERLEPQLRAYITEQAQWVRAAPREAARHSTLGLVYAANGLWTEARSAFQNAARLNPREPLAPLYVAVATQELGERDEALRLYRQITQQFPAFPQGFYRLGDLALRAGAVDEAQAAFEKLIVLAPQEWRGHAGLGEVKLRQGDAAAAANLLERALALDRNAKPAHHLLGTAYQRLGRTNDAQRELRLGLNALHFPMPDAWSASAPDHMRLLHDQLELAAQLTQAGRPRGAVEVLKQVLPFHPTNLAVLNSLGLAYHQAGEPAKARVLLEKAVQLDARYLPAHVSLSAACLALGLTDHAMTNALRAIELAPNTPQPHLAKANVLLALERDDEAVAALEAALRADPQNAQLQIELGDVLLRNLDRSAAALEHYQRASQLDPTSVEAQVRLADLHLRLGNLTAARAALESARKLAPNEPVLAVLEQRLKKVEQR